MPKADFIRPSSPSPASVTPKWIGKFIFSLSMVSTNNLTDCTITTVLEAFIEITTCLKSSATQIRKNSIQDSTMPAGVSP